MAPVDPGGKGPDAVLTLLRQLFEVSAAINNSVREVLAEFELTESTSGLLWMLDPDRPPLRMREIARALGCDSSNVTLIGDKLEQAGLVTRQAHPHDRRSRILALTDTGTDLRERLLTQLTAAIPLRAWPPASGASWDRSSSNSAARRESCCPATAARR